MSKHQDAFWAGLMDAVKAEAPPPWASREEAQAEVQKELDMQIERQRRALGLAKAMLPLQDIEGWKRYTEVLQDMVKFQTGTLIAKDHSEREMFRLQGEIRGLQKVLDLMENAEKRVQALEAGLARLHSQREAT